MLQEHTPAGWTPEQAGADMARLLAQARRTPQTIVEPNAAPVVALSLDALLRLLDDPAAWAELAAQAPAGPLPPAFLEYLRAMEPYAEASDELAEMGEEARRNFRAGKTLSLTELLTELARPTDEADV